ncbi:NAD(P)/FAD-dependent oxidoreductase [Patescibacteria group bacterium]|nr:NAD(P)/FAD-dependent oxidoreductase [Patescibacteria group bacterium]
MRTAIIGAGLTGLAAAYELSQKGHQVTVFEKGPVAGGLAKGIKGLVNDYPDDWDDLDAFYRHLFVSDRFAIDLINKLGLKNKLKFKAVKTSVLSGDRVSPFDSPLALLKFPNLSLADKFRAGLAVGWLKHLADWKKLEKDMVADKALRLFGPSTYGKLWEPLLRKKFGQLYSNVNMAWLWARLKKRSKKLGYLEGGFQVLVDRLAEEIEGGGGTINLNTPITRMEFTPTPSTLLGINSAEGSVSEKQIIKRNFRLYSGKELTGIFDIIIATVAPSQFSLLYPASFRCSSELPSPPFGLRGTGRRTGPTSKDDYYQKLRKLPSLGALSLVLALKKSLLTDGTYWLNVNNQEFPFLAVVEHTNFQPTARYGGHHIAYIGDYYDQPDVYQDKTPDKLIADFLPYLKKLNPAFDRDWIEKKWLFSNHFAQPVFVPSFSQLMPSLKTPIDGLYYASMWQVYPWDRGMNYAVELGERVASTIVKT